MTFDSIITIAAFCCYLIFMLCIGMYFVGKNRTTNEYFLGGRQLGSWVTSMSAQASDMSGWLLMGLRVRRTCPVFPQAGSPLVWLLALTLTGFSLQSVCASTPKPQVMRLRCRSSSKTVSTDESAGFRLLQRCLFWCFSCFTLRPALYPARSCSRPYSAFRTWCRCWSVQ